MHTIYCTDGDANEIIAGVGLTVQRFATPDGDHSIFGDISQGYKRQTAVDLVSLEGLLSGAGVIGYFTEAAMAKPRPGRTVPLLVELIAAGNRHDVVVPPLFVNSADSIAGVAPAKQLSLDEQHALFIRILGEDWGNKVSKLVAQRKAKKPK